MACRLRVRWGVLFVGLCMLAGLISPPPSSWAQRSSDAEFKAAVALWLAGDDEASLPALAVLATAGHGQARLLLARIETMDRGLSPFRSRLSRQESLTLFRKTEGEGKFGRSWLTVESENGNNLAMLLRRSRAAQVDPQLISALKAAGEHEAADHATRILALYGTAQQKRDMLTSDALLEDLRPYIRYLLATTEPRSDGLEALRHIVGDGAGVSIDDAETYDMAESLALGFWYGSFSSPNRWREPVFRFMQSSASMKPIVSQCSRRCSDQAQACSLTLMALIGGYYEAVRMDSPLESAIPQQTFLASPRAQLMTLRRAALMKTEEGTATADLASIARHSICLADLIRDARKKYP